MSRLPPAISTESRSSPQRFMLFGGLAQSLVNFRLPLIHALLSRGFEVEAMAGDHDKPSAALLLGEGVPLHTVDLNRTSLNPFSDVATLLRIASRLRSSKPTALLSYTVKPVVLGSLIARLVGVEHRFALITGLGFSFSEGGWRRKILSKLVTLAYKISLAGADTVFFQNPEDEAFFRKKILLPSTPSVVVRGSGVDTKYFESCPIDVEEPLKFLFIGRFLVEKGIRDLVEASKILHARTEKPFEVHTVGWLDPNPSGIANTELEGWISSKAIFHHGRQRDVRPFLRNAHVLVLPSFREGTPRSVLEAMSMGRAVIATDVPGCREAVVSESTGLLVPARNPALLAEAMNRLVQDRTLVQQFGAAGRRRVEQLYESSEVAANMVEQIKLTMET